MHRALLLSLLIVVLVLTGCGGGAGGDGEGEDETPSGETGPPEASFQIVTPPEEILVGSEVTFDATASDDGEGSDNLKHYLWDFDYEESSGFSIDKRFADPVASHRFYYPGAYQVALKVIDSEDLISAAATGDLTVADAEGAVINVE